ncbi:MAG: creatininase family protein [Candidatus Helarchaeales archaeon]
MIRVILPIGSFEQHGPHLPPETDTLLAIRFASEIASRTGARILEPIRISCSDEHLGFPETKSISREEFKSILENQINSELKRCDQFIIFNAHGGNSKILREILKNRRMILLLDFFQCCRPFLKEMRESKLGGICHAGELETSLMLYLHPDLVKKEKINSSMVNLVPELDPMSATPGPAEWKTMKFSKTGVLGDPTVATREKGEKWFKLIVNECIRIIDASN